MAADMFLIAIISFCNGAIPVWMYHSIVIKSEAIEQTNFSFQVGLLCVLITLVTDQLAQIMTNEILQILIICLIIAIILTALQSQIATKRLFFALVNACLIIAVLSGFGLVYFSFFISIIMSLGLAIVFGLVIKRPLDV